MAGAAGVVAGAAGAVAGAVGGQLESSLGRQKEQQPAFLLLIHLALTRWAKNSSTYISYNSYII